jgi:hypothetical protein
MRGNAARVIGALALGITALLASGCSGGGGGGDKATACKNMKQEISDFGKKQTSDPRQVGQAYSDLAKKFRSQATNAGDDKVKSAAAKAATALDGLSADMRSLAAGNVKVPNTQALQSSFAELQKACGNA